MMKKEMVLEVLKDIENTIDNRIASYVIDELREYESFDDIVSYLNDVLKYGCISGCVSSLIYYKDTEMFFDKYFDEIQETYDSVLEMVGENFIDISGNMKNNLSWFAYEHYSQLILDQLEYHLEYLELDETDLI